MSALLVVRVVDRIADGLQSVLWGLSIATVLCRVDTPDQVKDDIWRDLADVILIDWDLPLGTAAELVQETRRRSRFTRCVALVGNRVDLQAALDSGAHFVLLRGFSLGDLGAILENCPGRALVRTGHVA